MSLLLLGVALLGVDSTEARSTVYTLSVTLEAPLRAGYTVDAWRSRVTRHSTDGRTLTLTHKDRRSCWRVLVDDGAQQIEWFDPACDELRPSFTIYGNRNDGLTFQWHAPADYRVLGCFFRVRDNQLIACDTTGQYRHGPGSVDAALQIVPGEAIELRAYNAAGEWISRVAVYGAVFLPVVRT